MSPDFILRPWRERLKITDFFVLYSCTIKSRWEAQAGWEAWAWWEARAWVLEVLTAKVMLFALLIFSQDLSGSVLPPSPVQPES